MRRLFSILLVVFFGLGPLAITLQGSDDPRLPACCRRGGAHHCSMDDAALARIIHDSGAPAISAPSHCPLYPLSAPAAIASVHALAVLRAPSIALCLQSCLLPAQRVHALRSQALSRAVRGPPDIFLG